ncbi:MAG: hypothetical protein V1858_01655 [Candidatus Gottesmanbacteria bacterium]
MSRQEFLEIKMHKLLVQAFPLGTIGGGTGLGPFSNVGNQDDAITRFANGFSAIIGFLTVLAGLWFIFQFITGALQWIGSGGDPKSLQGAQQKIFNALLGFVVVVAAIAIMKVLEVFLGFNFLDVKSFIGLIGFK